MGTKEFDCQTCGACCISDVPTSPRYVQLVEADLKRLPAKYLLEIIPPRLNNIWSYEGLGVDRDHLDGPACVAFRGRAGDNCQCDMYEDRPKICREFESGGNKCLEVRSEFFARNGQTIAQGGNRAVRPFEWRTG